jgi:hypothetical protein
MKRLISLILTILLFLAPVSFAQKSSSGSSYKSYKSNSYTKSSYKKSSYKAYKTPTVKKVKVTTYKATSTKKHNKNYCATCQRDKNGKILRSEKSKKVFEKQTGYPHGRPGYVIDHIKPLKEGGADDPSNMQWQTVEEAKAKDKVE